MSNQEQKQPDTESKWEVGCGFLWFGFLGLGVMAHFLEKIDTPDERRLLVISIIAFVVIFLLGLLSAWDDEGRDGWWFGLIPAILVVVVIWTWQLWINPIIERIQEWIEWG